MNAGLLTGWFTTTIDGAFGLEFGDKISKVMESRYQRFEESWTGYASNVLPPKPIDIFNHYEVSVFHDDKTIFIIRGEAGTNAYGKDNIFKGCDPYRGLLRSLEEKYGDFRKAYDEFKLVEPINLPSWYHETFGYTKMIDGRHIRLTCAHYGVFKDPPNGRAHIEYYDESEKIKRNTKTLKESKLYDSI